MTMKEFEPEDEWESESQEFQEEEEDSEEELVEADDFMAVCNHCNMSMDVDIEIINNQEVHTYFCEGCDISISVYYPLRD